MQRPVYNRASRSVVYLCHQNIHPTLHHLMNLPLVKVRQSGPRAAFAVDNNIIGFCGINYEFSATIGDDWRPQSSVVFIGAPNLGKSDAVRKLLSQYQGLVSAYEVINDSITIDILDPAFPRQPDQFCTRDLDALVIDTVLTCRVKTPVQLRMLVVNVNSDEGQFSVLELNGDLRLPGIIGSTLRSLEPYEVVVCLDSGHEKAATKSTLYSVAKVFSNYQSKQPTTSTSTRVPSYASSTQSHRLALEARVKKPARKMVLAIRKVASNRARALTLLLPIHFSQPMGIQQQRHSSPQVELLQLKNSELESQVESLRTRSEFFQTKAKKMLVSMAEVRQDIVAAAQKYRAFRSQFEQLARQMLERENLVKLLQQNNEEAVASLEAKQFQHDELQLQINQLNELKQLLEGSQTLHAADLQAAQDVIAIQLDSHKKEIHIREAEIEKLKQEKTDFESKLAAVETERNLAGLQSENLQQKLEKQMEECTNLRRQLENQQQLVVSGNDVHRNLETTMEQERSEYARTKRQLEETLFKDKQDHAELKSQLEEALNTEKQRHAELKNQLEEALDAGKREQDRLMSDLESKAQLENDVIAQLRLEVTEKETVNAQLSASVGELETKVVEFQKKFKDYSLRNLEMAVETADLRARVSSLTQKLETTLEGTQYHEDVVKELQLEKEKLLGRVTELSGDMESLDEDNESLRSLLDAKKQEVADLQKVVQTHEGRNHQVMRQLQLAEDARDQAEAEMIELRASFEKSHDDEATASLELPRFDVEDIYPDMESEERNSREPSPDPVQVLKPMNNYREKTSLLMKKKKSVSPGKKPTKKKAMSIN